MEERVNFLIHLIATTILWACVTAFSCPDGMYAGDKGQCCRLCPQGTYLIRPCNESKGNSSCQQCPPEMYMDRLNNETQCIKCARCEPSQTATVDCQPSRNRQCGCERGKYLDTSFLFCMSCTMCPKGQGVASPCTSTTDTKCETCAKGTFSDTISFEDRCKDCTECNGVMKVEVECNTTMDTICERRNVSEKITTTQRPETSSVVRNSAGSQVVPAVQEDHSKYAYTFGITAVGFFIVVMAVVPFWYVIKRRRSGSYDANAPAATTSGNPARSRSSHGLRGRRTTHARNGSQHRESDSQGSNSSLQGVCVQVGGVKNKTLIRHLPGDIYENLGRLLNPKSFNNWVTLAGRLGFNNSDVKNFEIHPEEATQTVLTEWGQREGSTVDVLIDVLKEMKRDDCVEVLTETMGKLRS